MRRRVRARAAAGLVAVLVAAGLGACGDGSGVTGDDRPLLPVGATGAGGAESSAMVAGAPAPAADSAVASDADRSMMIAPVSPVEYRLADGAKAPATTATAYRVTPATGDVEGRVAEALGVKEGDGLVQVMAGAAWYYSRDPAGAVSSSVVDPATCSSDGKCEEPPMPEPPPGVPSAAEAEARFRTILDDLGIDVDNGTFETSGDDDPYQRQVSFAHTVDGHEVTGLETSVSFGEDGRIEFAGGFLGGFEAVGDYPLIDLGEALDRWQHGFGRAGGGMAVGMAEPAIATDTPAIAPSEGGSAEPTTGAPAPAEPQVVEVTGAKVVLEVVFPMCEGGDIYLVPAFELLPEDELGFSVTAVEEEATTQAAADPDADAQRCPGDDVDGDDPAGRSEPGSSGSGSGSGSGDVSDPMPPDADRGAIEPAPAPAPVPEPAAKP